MYTLHLTIAYKYKLFPFEIKRAIFVKIKEKVLTTQSSFDFEVFSQNLQH